MATCSSRPKIAGQSNRCCIWPLRHVATMAPSSPLPRHLDLLPTLCIAGSPRCIAMPKMSPLEKHQTPTKERLLPTVRMREERLPLYAMQEHLRDVFRKAMTAMTPIGVIVASFRPMFLHAMAAPTPASVRQLCALPGRRCASRRRIWSPSICPR